MYKLLATLSATTMVLLGCTSSSSTSTEDEVSENNELVEAKAKVSIEYTDESHLGAAHLVAQLIELELRQPVSVEQISGAEPSSDVEIFLAPELQEDPDAYNKLVALDLGITRGWYVPRSLEETLPELASWSDLATAEVRAAFGLVEPEDSYDFFYLGQPSEIDSQVIAATQLPVTLNQVENYEELEAYQEEQAIQDLPYVMIAETPNPAIAADSFLQLQTPTQEFCPDTNCSYQPVPLDLFLVEESEIDLSEIEALLSNLVITPDQYQSLNDSIVAGNSTDTAVSGWVFENLSELPKSDS